MEWLLCQKRSLSERASGFPKLVIHTDEKEPAPITNGNLWWVRDRRLSGTLLRKNDSLCLEIYSKPTKLVINAIPSGAECHLDERISWFAINVAADTHYKLIIMKKAREKLPCISQAFNLI